MLFYTVRWKRGWIILHELNKSLKNLCLLVIYIIIYTRQSSTSVKLHPTVVCIKIYICCYKQIFKNLCSLSLSVSLSLENSLVIPNKLPRKSNTNLNSTGWRFSWMNIVIVKCIEWFIIKGARNFQKNHLRKEFATFVQPPFCSNSLNFYQVW